MEEKNVLMYGEKIDFTPFTGEGGKKRPTRLGFDNAHNNDDSNLC